MSEANGVSIVMLVKNELPNLRRSLPIILAQDVGRPLEVIVIDSGSTDGSAELVEQLARSDRRIRLVRIQPHEFHHAATRNLGASLATGRYLVFLGGDAVPQGSDWLANLIRPVASGDPPVAASYGRQVPRPDADSNNVCRMSFNYGETSLIKGREFGQSGRDLYFFSSVSCCIDTAVIAPPYFDERFPVDEDATLSVRIINDGHRIAYCADSVVVHSHNYTYREILQRSFDNGVIFGTLGILVRGHSSVPRAAGEYLSTARRQLRHRGVLDKLRFVGFFLSSAIGVQLGMRYRWLPRPMRRVLSKYGSA